MASEAGLKVTASSSPAVMRQPRYRIDSGNEASIVVLSGANAFTLRVDEGVRLEMDGDVGRGSTNALTSALFRWTDDDASSSLGGEEDVGLEEESSYALLQAQPTSSTVVHLSPLEGRWTVVTGVSRAQPSMYRVKKLSTPKAAHADLLNFYASSQMSEMLLVHWDMSLDAQLAAITLMLNDARPQDTVIVLCPPGAISEWASRIERAALLSGTAGTPSQRVITVLVTTPQAYNGRFQSFHTASLCVVDRPPPGLEREHLPSAMRHCVVLVPSSRMPPVWSLAPGGRVCAFDARSHAALSSSYPTMELFRSDVDASLEQTVLQNVNSISRWPQVLVLHPLEAARRDAWVSQLSRVLITKLVPHPDDPEHQAPVEQTRSARVDVLDGSVSRSARDEVLRDVGRGSIDILVVSIAAWVNALYAGDLWCMKNVRVLHFVDVDTWADGDAWGTCIDAVSFAKCHSSLKDSDGSCGVAVIDYVVSSSQSDAYAMVENSRGVRQQESAALLQRSIPMPLTAKWKPRAPSTRSASSSSSASYWTPRRLQVALPFEGGGGWKVWQEGWNLLLCHQYPLLQRLDIPRSTVKALAKSALDAMSLELSQTQAADLDVHSAYARLVERLMETVASELNQP